MSHNGSFTFAVMGHEDVRGLGNGKKGMRVIVVDGVTSRERKSHHRHVTCSTGDGVTGVTYTPFI